MELFASTAITPATITTASIAAGTAVAPIGSASIVHCNAPARIAAMMRWTAVVSMMRIHCAVMVRIAALGSGAIQHNAYHSQNDRCSKNKNEC